MKKIIVFFLSLLAVTVNGFADTILLENQTTHPQKSKMAIQWASSAKEAEESNQAIMFGKKLNPQKLQFIDQSGNVEVNIPEKAEYFRVLVWSSEEKEPDLLTNWVDVVPNKKYPLKQEHLVPSVLMSGTGC